MQQNPPFIRLSLVDESGSAAGVHAWMRAGTTVAAGAAGGLALAGAVGDLSGASVLAYHVVYRGVEAPAPSAPGSNPVAGAGVFVFSCAGTDKYAIVVLPAIAGDLLLSSGPGRGILIDATNADVINFVETMIGSGFCNPFGQQLVALETAFLQWRP